MKTYAFSLIVIISLSGTFICSAQTDSVAVETTIIEYIDKSEKKSDKLNIFLNMHGEFAADWDDSEYTGARFKMNQLRIEAIGNIYSWLNYRFRMGLNRGEDDRGYFDNIMRNVDNAYIGVRMGKLKVLMGKQCAAYGGFEFDQNPIEIYEPSDLNGAGISYVTGVDAGYSFTPDQELHLQVVNSNSIPVQEQYGDYTPDKTPLMYTLNWNGNFNNTYRTRWSVSLMDQVKGHKLYYVALGNEVNLGRFSGFFDWMYSREGVDLRGIVSSIVAGDDATRRATSTEYMSYLLHLNYRVASKWNIFAKLMLENEGVYATHTAERDGATVDIAKGNYRTAYGYIGGLEYYPLKHGNLHFFATYVGRSYRYTARAKAFGAADYNTSRLSVGFVWKMPVY